jgi:hypothetical protein
MFTRMLLISYLVPVLFNVDAATLGEANIHPQTIRHNRKVVLVLVGNKRLHNESGDWSLRAAHLDLSTFRQSAESENAVLQTPNDCNS